MSPVPLGVDVAKFEVFHLSQGNFGHRAGDFPRDEGLAAPRALVVEEDSVADEHVVRLPVVPQDPVGVQFRNSFSINVVELIHMITIRSLVQLLPN